MPTVLVIDADANSNKLVRVVLEPEGWTVVGVSTLAEARAALTLIAPDVIVTELRLPDGLALALVTELKSALPTRRIPVIAVTGVNGTETRDRAHHAGCAAYIVKPIEVMRFASQVLAVLGGGK